MRRELIPLSICAYGLSIAVALFLSDPKLMSLEKLELSRVREPTRPTNHYGPAAKSLSSPEATFNYRGDERRLGSVDWTTQEVKKTSEFRLSFDWLAKPLNVGIHGASKASPAVDASGIYIGTDTGWFHKFSLDGKKAWSFYAGGTDHGIHATASLDQTYVYFGAYNGFLYCLEKDTGHPVWSIQLGDTIGSSTILSDGYLYSAVETNDPNGFLAKVRASDGKLMWTTRYIGDQVHSSVTLDLKNHLAISGGNAHTINAFDLESGEVVWTYATGAEIKGTGILVGEQYMIGSWDGFLYSIESSSGQLLWKRDLGAKLMSSLSFDAVGRAAFISSENGIEAFDISGGATLWKLPFKNEKVEAYNRQSGLILQSKSSVLVMQCDYKKICLVDPKNGRVTNELKLPEYYSGSPTYFDGYIYLALQNEGGLIRIAVN